MKTRVIQSSQTDSVDLAVATLIGGGLVAFPTDTVYGVAAPVTSSLGIERLFLVKERSTSKAIAVLIGDIDQLGEITTDLNQLAKALAQRFWPGALTLVVPRHPNLPDNLSQNPNVGVRMPNHPFALNLLRIFGPLATTSANLSGSSNPVSAEDVLDELDGRIELLIDGGATPGSTPSTVVDCTTPILSILREGVIPAAAILQVINQK